MFVAWITNSSSLSKQVSTERFSFQCGKNSFQTSFPWTLWYTNGYFSFQIRKLMGREFVGLLSRFCFNMCCLIVNVWLNPNALFAFCLVVCFARQTFGTSGKSHSKRHCINSESLVALRNHEVRRQTDNRVPPPALSERKNQKPEESFQDKVYRASSNSTHSSIQSTLSSYQDELSA